MRTLSKEKSSKQGHFVRGSNSDAAAEIYDAVDCCNEHNCAYSINCVKEDLFEYDGIMFIIKFIFKSMLITD